MMKYRLIDIDGEAWLELLEDPFTGIRYKYGRVGFEEPENEGDDVVLHFEFEVYDKRFVEQLSNDKLFQTTVGDILIDLIETQLKNQEVVYTGGV